MFCSPPPIFAAPGRAQPPTHGGAPGRSSGGFHPPVAPREGPGPSWDRGRLFKIFAPRDPSKGRDDTPGLLTDSAAASARSRSRRSPFAVRRGRASPRGRASRGPKPAGRARCSTTAARRYPSAPRASSDVALQDLLRKRDGLPPGDVPGDAPNDPDLHNFLDQLMRDEVRRAAAATSTPTRASRPAVLSSSFFSEIDLGSPPWGNRLRRRRAGRVVRPRAPRPRRNRRRMTRPERGRRPARRLGDPRSKLRDLEASGGDPRAGGGPAAAGALVRAAGGRRGVRCLGGEGREPPGGGGDGADKAAPTSLEPAAVGSAEMDDRAPAPGGAPRRRRTRAPRRRRRSRIVLRPPPRRRAPKVARAAVRGGTDPARCDLSDPRGADPARGEDAGPPEHGAPVRPLIQLYLPRRADTGDVSLVTHKDFSGVTVHEEKFWRYHEQSCAFFFNACRCPRTG